VAPIKGLEDPLAIGCVDPSPAVRDAHDGAILDRLERHLDRALTAEALQVVEEEAKTILRAQPLPKWTDARDSAD
jgi:hypothetical protein